MMDEMKKNGAVQSSEVKEEELEQAAGGIVGYGDRIVTCPKCSSAYGVVKSDSSKFKYYCTYCRKPFNL